MMFIVLGINITCLRLFFRWKYRIVNNNKFDNYTNNMYNSVNIFWEDIMIILDMIKENLIHHHY